MLVTNSSIKEALEHLFQMFNDKEMKTEITEFFIELPVKWDFDSHKIIGDNGR